MTDLDLYRYFERLPVDTAIERHVTEGRVDLRTIEEIDELENEELRLRAIMLNYIAERN